MSPRSSSSSTLTLRLRLDLLRRLTARDRQLLDWLAEHYVLSVSQITAALFPSYRAATLRLRALYQLGALDRFADLRVTGGREALFALGPLGLVTNPTLWNHPGSENAAVPRSSAERTARIIGSPRLGHLLGTNQFFIDLVTHSRTHPETQLRRWWSEQHATSIWSIAGIRPDGHGLWTVTNSSNDRTANGSATDDTATDDTPDSETAAPGGATTGDHPAGELALTDQTSTSRTVGFFLEHDNGTEPLKRVVSKLRAYSDLAAAGPRYPVLLRVPGPRRERHLLTALADTPTPMPVATSTHDRHPAGAAWLLAADPSYRRALHELPSDHGPRGSRLNPRPDLDLDEHTGAED